MAITFNVYNEARHSIWVEIYGLPSEYLNGGTVSMGYKPMGTASFIIQNLDVSNTPDCYLEFPASLSTGVTYNVFVDLISPIPGHKIVTYDTNIYIPSDPTEMEWDTPKVSGRAFNLTAAEWNGQLLRALREIKSYLGFSTYIPENVSSGDQVTAELFGDIIDAMRGLTIDTELEKPLPGEVITANMLNYMRNDINRKIYDLTH